MEIRSDGNKISRDLVTKHEIDSADKILLESFVSLDVHIFLAK